MKPLGISVAMLAGNLGLSETYTRALLDGDVKVTPELSKRLADCFGMSELFFYKLQNDIDSRNADVKLKNCALVDEFRNVANDKPSSLSRLQHSIGWDIFRRST